MCISNSNYALCCRVKTVFEVSPAQRYEWPLQSPCASGSVLNGLGACIHAVGIGSEFSMHIWSCEQTATTSWSTCSLTACEPVSLLFCSFETLRCPKLKKVPKKFCNYDSACEYSYRGFSYKRKRKQLKHKDSFGKSENLKKIFFTEILVFDHDYEGKSSSSNGLLWISFIFLKIIYLNYFSNCSEGLRTNLYMLSTILCKV